MRAQKTNALLEAYRASLERRGLLSWMEVFSDAEVYLVGGAVRDCIMERPDTKDYDFVVCKVPIEEVAKRLERYGAVNYVGKTFGVLKVKLHTASDQPAIDVALPRTEHAWGTGKYKDVEVQSDHLMPIEMDLARRDFTINAMAVRINGVEEQRLIDKFDGMGDIAQKVIRAVGSAEERMQEDYSRALRALRFAANLGFTIETSTWNAVRETVQKLDERGQEGGEWIVPREVIASELLCALEKSPVRAVDWLERSGAMTMLIPEVNAMKGCPQPVEFHSEGDVWVHTMMAVAALESPAFAETFLKPFLTNERAAPWDAEVALAVLLHDIGKPSTLQTPETHGVDRIRFNGHAEVGASMAARVVDRLKLTAPDGRGVDKERLIFLIRHHMVLVHGEVAAMRPTTIEKYFFSDPVRGEKLLKLFYCDGTATIPMGGNATLQEFQKLITRINALKVKGSNTLPPSLLTGDDIMALLKIGPGRIVGEVLTKLREAQLKGTISTYDEACQFVMTKE